MTMKKLKEQLFSYLDAGGSAFHGSKSLEVPPRPYGSGKKRPCWRKGIGRGDATGYVDRYGKAFHTLLEELWSLSRILQEAMKDGYENSRTNTRVLGEDIAKDLACARTFAGILYGFSNLSSVSSKRMEQLAKCTWKSSPEDDLQELYRKCFTSTGPADASGLFKIIRLFCSGFLERYT